MYFLWKTVTNIKLIQLLIPPSFIFLTLTIKKQKGLCNM